jgi:hypothetical protein
MVLRRIWFSFDQFAIDGLLSLVVDDRHHFPQVKSCFFQDSVLHLVRSRCFGRIQCSERFDGNLWCDVEDDVVCCQGLFEFLEVWLFLSTPDAIEFLAELVQCDCDLAVLCLAFRLVDDWSPALKVDFRLGCFPNLYQMTHSIELLFPRNHIPQLVELIE